MDASLAFGVALGAAGVAASLGVRARHGERILARLGAAAPERAPRPPGWMSRRAAQRGWWGDARTYGAALIGLATVGAAAGFRLAGPVGGVAGAVAGVLALETFLSRRLDRRAAQLEEQLGDWVAALAAATRAGLSLRRALAESARDAEPPLRDHLEAAVQRLAVGEPLEEVLHRLADAIGSRDAALLVSMFLVHRRTGGSLAGLLDQVAGIIAQRSSARRELRALTAQGRASGTVLAVLPIAFVTLLSWTGGDGLGAFYRSARGALLLAAGLLCELLGLVWIRRIVRPREHW